MIDGMDIEGRIDDLTPETAFVLGVEWQMVRSFAMAGEEIHTRPVHTSNARRIEKMLAKYGYYQEWEHRDDWSFVTASLEKPT